MGGPDTCYNNATKFISTLAKGAVTLVPALSQNATNGNSTYGTLECPTLEKYLPHHGSGFPWGNFDSKTNSHHNCPDTGVTRSYDFTVSRAEIAPDGCQIEALVINGQFPGPTIEANWGDWIEVTVHNKITGPEEGTGLHWHGLLQTGTPFMDGVPGVSQCPIAPDSSFKYKFRADQHGSSWYHSHYAAQYASGLLGPLIIHGPSNVDYDIDLGPVLLSDWYHTTALDIVNNEVMGPFNPNAPPSPLSDNNLINGKMNYNCSTPNSTCSACTDNAGIAKFKFTKGKKHRLRLVNTGAQSSQIFSVDGHKMSIIANDFVQIQPYDTTIVTIGIGQRTDVIIEANQDSGAFWMRSDIQNPNVCSFTKQAHALAAIYYDGADTKSMPTSSPQPYTDPGTCGNDDLSKTVPWVEETPDKEAEVEYTWLTDFSVNASNVGLWSLNNVSSRIDYNKPALQSIQGGNSVPAPYNSYDVGYNKTLRIIVNNVTPAPHPMHLHGHTMSILAEGPGTWDGTIVNPKNPQRRDVQMLRPFGFMVFQIALDNPGVWPFHCHIAWHLSAGLSALIDERPDDIKKIQQISQVGSDTCTDWNAYTDKNVVDQTDSGL